MSCSGNHSENEWNHSPENYRRVCAACGMTGQAHPNNVCRMLVVLVHLLQTRGERTECGVGGEADADIERVTCEECIALHDSMMIRDSQS